ncbi:hypothetical protein GUJ93_ZPchr0002g25624 [Zizania palustris]|uniref:Uncharacterized protein n=1 Tax=Zizania palustris TaxID=103762 RepID=A0A8J5V4E7_ZIZPA|nr:hypothetical protein GUJ93_ZPchr0002g25624 [Zizania palustris]
MHRRPQPAERLLATAVARPRVALGHAPRLRQAACRRLRQAARLRPCAAALTSAPPRPRHAPASARPHACTRALRLRVNAVRAPRRRTRTCHLQPLRPVDLQLRRSIAAPAPPHASACIAIPSPLRAARRRPYRRAHKRPPRLASVHPHTPRTFLSTLEHSPEPSELALAGNPPEPNSIATVRPQILLIPFSIPWDVNPDVITDPWRTLSRSQFRRNSPSPEIPNFATDNDDHSNINYDDIIIDDEQDGAGLDDDQDEDPEEIKPMPDDEE